MHCLPRYEALGKLREHSKSQNDLPGDRSSPEIRHESRAVRFVSLPTDRRALLSKLLEQASRANSQVPLRVCDVERCAFVMAPEFV